ncbi:hypothetical protein ACFE04_022446 [Oxalis oulophora]
MECLGMMAAFGEWNSLSGLFSSNEEAEFMSQLLNSYPVLTDQLDSNSSSGFWPNMSTRNPEMIMNNDEGCWSEAVGSFSLPALSHDQTYHLRESSSVTNFLMDDCLNVGGQIGGDQHVEYGMSLQLKSAVDDGCDNLLLDNPKKRTRAQGNVHKNKKEKRPRKNALKSNKVEVARPATSSVSSEQDESNNGSVSSKETVDLQNGKARATRGAATDPQSLYARKRRERINERLRTLQNLVPNGTKVDISTMLEEAVEYVKFLQLQIKMLSSDDHWMYAPLAYNGMNLGLDININTQLKSS